MYTIDILEVYYKRFTRSLQKVFACTDDMYSVYTYVYTSRSVFQLQLELHMVNDQHPTVIPKSSEQNLIKTCIL